MNDNNMLDEVYKGYPSKSQMMHELKRLHPEMKNIAKRVSDYLGWKGDIYRRPSRVKRFSKFNETVVDRQHQADLMDMPKDSRHKWTYLLTYIDVASRRGMAIGVTNKTAPTILKALQKVYAVMKHPYILQTDDGGEFKGVVNEYLEEQGIRHVATLQKNHQAIVERFNQTIAKPLFRYMDETEVAKGEEYRLNRWSDVLDDVIETYNNRYHNGVKGVPAVLYEQKQVAVKPREAVVDTDVLSAGTAVRKVIDKTEHRRSTDPYWSREVFMVGLATKKSDSDPIKYKLLNTQDLGVVGGSFYREELLVVNDVK